MKILSKYNLIGLTVLLLGLASCDTLETAKQDAEPIISPDGYPVATFTSSEPDNTVMEGDTLYYTIKTNKMLDRAVTFRLNLVGGDLTEDGYIVEPAVLQPYTDEVQMMIIFNDDGVPAPAKTAQFEIAVESVAERYLLNPSQVFPAINLTVENYFDPTLLTIAMSWATDDDFDMVTWSNTTENPMTEWGDGGATTANPEIDHSIWLSDPVGIYYVSVMDWEAGPFDYTFTICHPDGTLQTITGTFDASAPGVVNDPWTAWGGSYDSYRVLQVVNNGDSFTVTKL